MNDKKLISARLCRNDEGMSYSPGWCFSATQLGNKGRQQRYRLIWVNADYRPKPQSLKAARLPRGYRVALYMSLQDFARAQPAFLTQNLHQPAGLISPSTSVQAFGSWNREQLLHC